MNSPFDPGGTTVKEPSRTKMLLVIFGVVGICGVVGVAVLASIAIPRYHSFSLKARQSEAKVSLTHLYTLQEAHFAMNENYSSDLTELGFQLAEGARYQYQCQPKNNGFVCWARGNIDEDPAKDVWRINQSRDLKHIKDDMEN